MSKPLILFGPLPPPYGGVSVFLSTLFTHLRTFNVHLWTYFGTATGDDQIEHFNHRRLGIVRLLFRHGGGARIVDFSHFHLEYPNPILLPIWLAAKVLLRFYWYKCICDGSLPARHVNFTAVERFLFRRAIRATDEFIVVSSELREWLKEEIGVTQEVTVIRSLLNTPDAPSKSISSQYEPLLRSFLGRDKKVSSIGTFIPDYGFAHVANAVEAMREKTGTDVGLLLLDGTFATDEEYREQVLKNRPWITVLSNVPNPEVYQILRRCDLFIRGFGRESYGISRVEAIWCGVPVIATNVGETRGMVTYEFGDEKKLAELIQKVILNEVREDLKTTSDLFRAEADQNLRKFVETVKLKD